MLTVYTSQRQNLMHGIVDVYFEERFARTWLTERNHQLLCQLEGKSSLFHKNNVKMFTTTPNVTPT